MDAYSSSLNSLESSLDAISGAVVGFGIFWGIIALLGVIAYFVAIALIVKQARKKECGESSFKLWFLGLFLSPLVLGVIVAAMPDRAPCALPANANLNAGSIPSHFQA